MKQKGMKNLDLKVLAVLLSIVIWIIVVNIDDPVKNIQFNDVPIQFINTNVLTEKNEVYEVLDGTDTVDVVVSGRRSVIEDLSKENISVVADLQKLTDQGEVPLKVTSNKHSNEIDGMKTLAENVRVNIEELKKIQKVIRIETEGRPAEGYIIGDCSLNLNQVYIEGPSSVVDTIYSAKVKIDVSGASDNMSASAPIVLYSSNGEVVDTTRLSLNINSVSVNQEILYTKKVSISCIPNGTPAEGYKATGRTDISPEFIEIAGRKSVIDSINQVTIPSSVINISDQKSAYKTSVDIENYLPKGVELSSGDSTNMVSVIVYIEKEIEESVEVSLNKISINNLPEGFKAEIVEGNDKVSDGKISISVIGLSEDLDDLTASDITLSVNIEDYLKDNNLSVLREGTITIPLDVLLPSGVKNKEEIKLRLKISAT